MIYVAANYLCFYDTCCNIQSAETTARQAVPVNILLRVTDAWQHGRHGTLCIALLCRNNVALQAVKAVSISRKFQVCRFPVSVR